MNAIPMTRGAASRGRIVEVAHQILAAEGLERFVLREIAKRAGMQLGNLQYYFATREDLLEAVIEVEFANNLAAMHALEDQARDLKDYMKRLVQLMIREYTGLGGRIWPVLSLLHLHNRRFRDQSRAIYQEHFDTIVRALQRYGVAGRRSELVHKARLITALIDGASLQAHAGPHSRDSASWRALCRRTGELAIAIAAG